MHETPLGVGNSLLLVGLDESRGVVETFGFPQSVLTESPQQPYSVIIAPVNNLTNKLIHHSCNWLTAASPQIRQL